MIKNKKLIFEGWYIIASNLGELEALAEKYRETNPLLHDKIERISTKILRGLNLIRKGLGITDWWELKNIAQNLRKGGDNGQVER